MSEWFVNISCFLRTKGRDRSIEIRISEPRPVHGEIEYRCLIQSPVLLLRDTEIAGIDADQARELSVEFVKSMVGDSELVDQDGNSVEL